MNSSCMNLGRDDFDSRCPLQDSQKKEFDL